MRPPIPSRTTSKAAEPSSSAPQERVKGCDKTSIVIHGCEDFTVEQPSNDGFLSRLFPHSLRVVLFNTKTALPTTIKKTFYAALIGCIGLLLIVKTWADGKEKESVLSHAEEIEMEEGVNGRENTQNRKGKEISHKIQPAEHHGTSEPFSSASSSDSCDSCESLIGLTTLKPQPETADTRSTTWNSVEQIKARKVLGFRGLSISGAESTSEDMTSTNKGEESSSRASTWGSRKALKVLGFERQNSRLINAMAMDTDEITSYFIKATRSGEDCDYQADDNSIALQDITRPERAKLVEPNASQDHTWVSPSNVLRHPSVHTSISHTSGYPAYQEDEPILGITETFLAPERTAKAVAVPYQEEVDVTNTPLPRSLLRPLTFRNLTAPTILPYCPLISDNNANPTPRPLPETEPPPRRRPVSPAPASLPPLVSRTTSTPQILRPRSTSLNNSSALIEPLARVPISAEPRLGPSEDRSGRDETKRLHRHRLWERTCKDCEAWGDSGGVEGGMCEVGRREERGVGRKAGESGRGGRFEALRALGFKKSESLG